MADRINLFDAVVKKRRAGEAVALATVVRVEKPSSAHPGDSALITPDGEFRGWVGGSCAQPTILREALIALREGIPRYVRLTPPENRGKDPQENVIEVTLTCISGGTLEVYIEPIMPQPQLIAIGHLPVIRGLVKLAAHLDYRITVAGLDIAPEDLPGADRLLETIDFSDLEGGHNTYVVVASHGNYDEMALEWALKSNVDYVALVTSRKRGTEIVDLLRSSGTRNEDLQRLKYPAGLDIGAKTPEEIALSILAEITEVRRRTKRSRVGPEAQTLEVYQPDEVKDPVCGMMVDVISAQFTTEYHGQTYFFCAQSCLTTFEREPDKYSVDIES